jgi:CDP-6-deoxy-D-xylo-4-hexulose-3-dehydrase
MKIPLASSGLRTVDIQSAIEVLNSGNLTMGQMVREFELQMSKYLKVEHFIMMNSGSSANLAIIEALLRPANSKPKLKSGDGVIVPAIAWPTTIWPLIQLGLKPIFVDVADNTLAIDLQKAQRSVDEHNGQIKALFPIHPLGYGIEANLLSDFCLKNEIILINDVCESLGSWRNGQHAGTNGIAGSFSFYFSHHITTMEGGGVATNDPIFADDLRSIRSHGWVRDRIDSNYWKNNNLNNDAKFLFVSSGFNIRPMEIQAAIGISQIKDIDEFIEKRIRIAQRVKSAIRGTNLKLIGSENLTLPKGNQGHSWMLLPIQITSNNATESRLTVISELETNGIETRPALTGNFLTQPAIKNLNFTNQEPKEFTSATKIAETTFLVSAHHDLSEDQIEYLCEKLKLVAIDLK